MENINDQINALEERMYKSEYRIYNAQQELISNLEKIKDQYSEKAYEEIKTKHWEDLNNELRKLRENYTKEIEQIETKIITDDFENTTKNRLKKEWCKENGFEGQAEADRRLQEYVTHGNIEKMLNHPKYAELYKSELRKSTRKLDLKMLDLKMEDLLEKPNTGLKIKQLKDRCGNFAKPAESFKPAYSFFMKAR